MRVYLGVDPGVTGAFAVLEVADDGLQTLSIHPTPVLWVKIGKSQRRRYEIPPLLDLLATLPRITLAYLEQQSARPGQGAASTFQTGWGEGMWSACLTACAIPFQLVSPVAWRRLVHLPHVTDKQARKAHVRLAAVRRFPAVPLKLQHADAVMLAVAAALEHGTGAAAC